MNGESGPPSTEHPPNVAAGMAKRVASVVLFLVLMALVLFLSSGRPTWIWAWVYLGILVVSSLVVGAITMSSSPEIVALRGEMPITKIWDKILSALFILAFYFALPLVAGLDLRFGWTGDLSVAWHVAGTAVLILGVVFYAWAMIANAYFSTAVRIQSERGQAVCDSGPYRLVRHPGYVGLILQPISVPFLLGSLWALIPGIIASACMIVRTSFEDRMLQAELHGYQEYVQKVRYRLLPGVW